MRQLANFLSGARGDSSSAPPCMLKVRSSRIFIISTICLAVFTDLFLYGVIVPVIPFAISARADVAESDVQYWISVLLAVYGGALFVASPIAGWYADNSSSRRLPLLIGLLALAGATLILCLARNVGLLITGRVLQGLSAAIVWTTGQALLVDTVGQKDIGQIMGYVSISMSLGILIAPLLGGVVYNRAGYFAVYYMAFALIFLDVTMRLGLIEKKIAIQWLEPGQESTRTLQEVTPSSNVPEAEAVPPSDVTPPNEAVVSPETHEPEPASTIGPRTRSSRLPPVITLLGSRRLLAALWGCFLQGAIATAFDSVVPIFVSRTFLWDSTGAGLVFLAPILPTFISPLIGALSDRYGPRWLVVGGFLFGVPFWVLLRFVTDNTTQHKILFCALLSLIGISLMLVMAPLMAEITYVVEAKERRTPGLYGKTGAYAQAYGLFVTAYAGGSLVGPLWGGLVVEKAGWGTMSLTLGLLMASGAVPSLIWTGGLITRNNAKSGNERAVERLDEKSRTEEPAVIV
jgi:MFS family permease